MGNACELGRLVVAGRAQAATNGGTSVLPGFIPNGPHDDTYTETLALLAIAQAKLPAPMLAV